MDTTIDNLSDHLGPVYTEIDQDVTRLHANWKLILQLFGSQESVDILNQSAGFAIRTIQDSLTDGVILRIAKLTDPAKTGRLENLSLASLIEHLPSDPPVAKLRDRLATQLDSIGTAVDGMRTIRNKRIAHRDHASAIDPNEIIPGVPLSAIEESIRLIREFMHDIQGHYGFGGTVYDMVELGRDGDHLLFRLQCGHKFIDLNAGFQLRQMSDSDVLNEIKQLPKRKENVI